MFQMLPTTFAAYASKGTSLWNPLAEGIAAIRYIIANWGSVYNIPGILGGQYNGYANGGIISEPVFGVGLHSGQRYSFAENAPEVVTPLNRMGASGGGHTYNINFNGVVTDPDATAMKVQQMLRNLKVHRGNQPLGLD
jgi:SLT domain-containing protein